MSENIEQQLVKHLINARSAAWNHTARQALRTRAPALRARRSQDYKDKPADASLGQPPHLSIPSEGEHLASPEPGHPAGDTAPYGGEVPDPEHPETIGGTQPEQDRA